MKGHRRSRTLIQLTQLLTIASTASAVSLLDFQDITIIQVPSISCLGAYGRTLFGCSRGDFKNGAQCSASCAAGVQQEQANLIAACRNIEVNARSLLGLALQGGLLDALCPGFEVTTSVTQTVEPTTTRTFLTPSQTRETLTSTTTTAETSSTITTSSTTEGSESSTTSLADGPGATDTTVISSTPTETSGMTTISTTPAPSPTQTANNQGGGSSGGSSGGGSPFDVVFAGSGTEAISKTNVGLLAVLTGYLIIVPLMG